MKRAQSGYTLLELMLVTILIGIATSLAVPQISQGWANNTVSEAATETILIFRAARTLAKRDNRPYGVFIDNGGPRHLVRLDRSVDANKTCGGLPACTTAPPGFGGADCGLQYLDLEEPHYFHKQVKSQKISTNDGTSDVIQPNIRICVPERGPVVEMVAGAEQNINGYVVISIHRLNGAGIPVGVKRHIIAGQNGLARLWI